MEIEIYANGIAHCLVCAPASMDTGELLKQANAINPTGTHHSWQLDASGHFNDGKPMPCPCDENPDSRLHYLLTC